MITKDTFLQIKERMANNTLDVNSSSVKALLATMDETADEIIAVRKAVGSLPPGAAARPSDLKHITTKGWVQMHFLFDPSRSDTLSTSHSARVNILFDEEQRKKFLWEFKHQQLQEFRRYLHLKEKFEGNEKILKDYLTNVDKEGKQFVKN